MTKAVAPVEEDSNLEMSPQSVFCGLSSRLTFRCKCGQLTQLVTSKTLKKKKIHVYTKRGAYAVNVKAALG